MTAPRRHWFRSLLPPLLMVLMMAAAVATLVVCVIAWHSSRPAFSVVGNVSESEIADVCGLVAGAPALSRHSIDQIEAYAPGKIAVTTKLPGLRSRGGAIVLFEKEDDAWTIVNIEPYTE